MRRIGILGGTFNPVHNTHIMLAETAYCELGLDTVYFMPSKHPPHKPNSEIISDEDRLAMLRLAVQGHEGLDVLDIELRREGTTFTADTLKILNDMYPDDRIYFIIGGDSLKAFDTWHEPGEILHRCALVCAGRGDYACRAAIRDINKLCRKYTTDSFSPEITFLDMPASTVSSNVIRRELRCGRKVTKYMPRAVADYIAGHELYSSEVYCSYRSSLKSLLSAKRYRHVINVANLCYKLGEIHGVDPERAYVAGLLHDCAKHLDRDTVIAEARRLRLHMSKAEHARPCELMHSRIGAEYARSIYGITDSGIINSIYWHTVGHPAMTRLEQIVFLADVIEPSRTMQFNPSLDVIRSIATYDIDKATAITLANIVSYLAESPEEDLSEATFRAYYYYRRLSLEKKGEQNG